MHRPVTGRLVIATHNPGKLVEMRDLLARYGVEAVSAGDLDLPEPEETGTTFAANARIKAKASAQASGMPALADDSGLVVDALDGAPGVYSARWAGPHKDFAAAMRRVEDGLQAAGATTPEARTARFVAVLCLAWPSGASGTFRGEVRGHMIWPPRGDNGFGYD
ncbi:MAG: non-canonical purine NTP pyrophosphatase, partial [Xanthobacteraceae bacterium]